MNLDLRRLVFRFRGYTPVPLIIFALLGSDPRFVPVCSGLVLVLCGEGLRIWGIGYTGATTRSRRVQANRLITDGPYAYLRNPLYVGNFLLSLGCCLIAWAWMPWMLVLFLTAFGLQYRLIVSLEEEELERIFGEEYRNYALHVPRFFPRRFPYQEGERVVPDFKKALQSERSTFATITGFLLLLFVRRILL